MIRTGLITPFAGVAGLEHGTRGAGSRGRGEAGGEGEGEGEPGPSRGGDGGGAMRRPVLRQVREWRWCDVATCAKKGGRMGGHLERAIRTQIESRRECV